MAFSLSISIITCLLSTLLMTDQQKSVTSAETLSRVCLGCICEAASGCNVTLGCDGHVCGPFRITWNYWADAGKPTLNDKTNANENGYAQCVNDPYCAARTVQGYMTKFGQVSNNDQTKYDDCNGDGNINCDDFLRIHRLGGYGCSDPLDTKYENTYKLCMQTFEKQ